MTTTQLSNDAARVQIHDQLYNGGRSSQKANYAEVRKEVLQELVNFGPSAITRMCASHGLRFVGPAPNDPAGYTREVEKRLEQEIWDTLKAEIREDYWDEAEDDVREEIKKRFKKRVRRNPGLRREIEREAVKEMGDEEEKKKGLKRKRMGRSQSRREEDRRNCAKS